MWDWAVQMEEVYGHPNNMNRFRVGGGCMMAMLYLVGVVLPLYFMWSIRHHKKK
jgi:hypothetical protein